MSPDELALLAELEKGRTVVVSLRQHPELVRTCRDRGLLERVDRRSRWGNPFRIGRDGDRAAVIQRYRDEHLPAHPELVADLATLAGRALACWCAPEPCHGDVLAELSGLRADDELPNRLF